MTLSSDRTSARRSNTVAAPAPGRQLRVVLVVRQLDRQIRGGARSQLRHPAVGELRAGRRREHVENRPQDRDARRVGRETRRRAVLEPIAERRRRQHLDRGIAVWSRSRPARDRSSSAPPRPAAPTRPDRATWSAAEALRPGSRNASAAIRPARSVPTPPARAAAPDRRSTRPCTTCRRPDGSAARNRFPLGLGIVPRPRRLRIGVGPLPLHRGLGDRNHVKDRTRVGLPPIGIDRTTRSATRANSP